MAEHGFDIKTTPASLEVFRDPRPKPKERFQGAAIIIGTMVLAVCALVFLPGKHEDPSMWHALANNSIGSPEFLFPASFVFCFLVIFGWFSIRWTLAAWPADDALRCDAQTFTALRERWFDTTDTMTPVSFPLASITDLRYAVIARAKNSAIYGLRFRLDGKKQKLLAGLEAPEAGKILEALKALGADVPDDPKLQKRIKEAMSLRVPDTSWMDTSWMEHK